MTGPITETTVTIRGVDYQLRGDAAPQHMAALAAHVDEKMRLLEEAARGMTQTPARLAILASLMIADELFQERARHGREFEESTDRLLRLTLDLRAALTVAGDDTAPSEDGAVSMAGEKSAV